MRLPAENLFAIYLHWPFCAAKCPYCDFNSHVADRVDQQEWSSAFVREIGRLAEETKGRHVSSIYFGGGTPSLMEAATVSAILDAIARHWSFRNDVEITLEANPSSVEAAHFQGYRAAGVNRVSMGFQSLRDEDLRRLGRLHDVKGALAALEIARTTFDRVSFDLIYARQDQSLSDWQAELTEALALGPDHLSLYQLTIEEGTAFSDRFKRGGLKGLPDEDLAVDLFNLTQDLCEHAGLPAYEVSNHARPGNESRHNLTYWRGGDYLGIGPGAHGRLAIGGSRFATESPLQPGKWLQQVRDGRGGESLRSKLSDVESAEELLMMGVRTSEGLNLAEFGARTGHSLASATLEELRGLGLLELGDDIRATRAGRLVLNAVIRKLALGLVQN